MRTKPRSVASSVFALSILTAGMIATAVVMATNPADAGPRNFGSTTSVSGLDLGSGR